MIEPTIFWGATTEHRADLYVRLATTEATEDDRRAVATAQITGFVEGPFRADAATLKSRAMLRDLGNDPSPLSRVTLIDPCFWSPWSPATYELTITLRSELGEHATWRRKVGVRRLAAREGSFRWEGRRWVFRGVNARPQDEEQCRELSELRGGLCLTTNEFHDELGAWATRYATPIAIVAKRIDITRAFAIARDCPAVWTIVAPLECDEPFNELKSRYAPNLLLGCWDELGRPTPAWADAHWGGLEVLRDSMGQASHSHGAAHVAVAPASVDESSIHEQRKMCDALQRASCPIGDLAGFVVGWTLEDGPAGLDITKGTGLGR